MRVDGGDAEKLLQGIVTNDVELAGQAAAPSFAALLTPQGKILFDFFVARHGGSFLLETAADQTADLVKRLEMYRLRARSTSTDASDKLRRPGGLALRSSAGARRADVSDVRSSAARTGNAHAVGARRRIATDGGSRREANATPADYHAHRIALGVPEGGKDYVFGDTFPHEANMDLLNGVSFSKGCFVGQEVVSRMQHRGTARKRIVIVEGDKPLQTGSEITAGQATIGTIGSVAGNRALALVRLDRVEEMQRKGEQITAAGAALTIQLPAYMTPAVPAATP